MALIGRKLSFRSRMLAALVVFVLFAEMAVATAILHMSYVRIIDQAHQRLDVSERVLDQLMSLRNDHLLSTVDILTSDFGFRSAVATRDGATLKTSLDNFRSRVQADFAVLLSPTGEPMTTIPETLSADADLPITELLRKARATGSATGLLMIDDRPTQFVLVPVNAPRLIAWTGMGFVVDRQLAETLADLTGVNVTFVVTQDNRRVFDVSSRPGLDQVDDSTQHLVHRQRLLETDGKQLTVVLSLARADVVTGYYRLARQLLLIFFVTLLASALLALWLSRKLSSPVAEMSDFARTVASGAYSSSPPSHGISELDQLAGALTDMRDAVHERETQIRHQATHDALTDLPNRGEARRYVATLLVQATPFAAVRVAVRSFAQINSALGYQLGDRTIQTVAERLKDTMTGDGLLARTEGNDFMLVLPGIADRAALDARLRELRDTLEAPMYLDGGTLLQLEYAIGALLCPEDADDTESVWRRSTIVRDWSAQHRGSIAFYDKGMDERQQRELTIIRDLPGAVTHDELALAFQPKLNLATGDVQQVEALLRWQHPKLGAVPADEFISLAERSGQIHTLTCWVTHTAAAQLRAWRAAGLSLGMSLNLSADELADDALCDKVAPVLAAAPHAGAITLEVTESAVLREPDAALANLRRLQRNGARIAIDDFGSGYSSFFQLRQLDADELKIDKSLVLELVRTPSDRHIVSSIIQLGHQLGLDVVVEGVENESSLRWLAGERADSIQGYYLARPMSGADLEHWISRHRTATDRWSAVALS